MHGLVCDRGVAGTLGVGQVREASCYLALPSALAYRGWIRGAADPKIVHNSPFEAGFNRRMECRSGNCGFGYARPNWLQRIRQPRHVEEGQALAASRPIGSNSEWLVSLDPKKNLHRRVTMCSVTSTWGMKKRAAAGRAAPAPAGGAGAPASAGAAVTQQALPRPVARCLESLLERRAGADRQVRRLKLTLAEAATLPAYHAVVSALREHPGVGPLAAIRFVLELGSIARFRSPATLAHYPAFPPPCLF